MADIDIQCPNCKTINSISEFADVPFVACKSCGRSIERLRTSTEPNSGRKLKLRDTRTAPSGETPPRQGYLATIKPPKRQKRISAWRPSQHITAAVLFLALGTGMWFLRYGGYLSSSQLNIMKQYAPAVVLGFHILILLKAFQDSVFQGILCLLVPGYSLIYLFFINDDYYARAVFAGLLVGIAQDSYAFFHAKALGIYETITAWLAHGG